MSAPAPPDAVVAAARSVTDVFAHFGLPARLSGTLPDPERPLSLSFHSGRSAGVALRAWMLRCVETLAPLYATSRMRFCAVEKAGELAHADQRFLVVGGGGGADEGGGKEEPIAFLSFRWDVEEGRPVMYIYELFVDAAARSRRIGLQLMCYAERLAALNNVSDVMLTVFDCNQAALKLYRQRLSYVSFYQTVRAASALRGAPILRKRPFSCAGVAGAAALCAARCAEVWGGRGLHDISSDRCALSCSARAGCGALCGGRAHLGGAATSRTRAVRRSGASTTPDTRSSSSILQTRPSREGQSGGEEQWEREKLGGFSAFLLCTQKPPRLQGLHAEELQRMIKQCCWSCDDATPAAPHARKSLTKQML